MRNRKPAGNMFWALLFFFAATVGFSGCGDVNHAPAPPIPPGALAIATSTLPSGSLGIFYDVTLAPTGGNAPYSWSLSSGSLPNGLNLASSGRISGTPTTIQTTNPTFRLQDSSVPTAEVVTKLLPMSITAVPQPTITTPSPLPNGIVNLPYPSTPLEAVGGTPPYTWSATVTPALPSGLTFDAATATISGTPTVTETNVKHTFSVTDSFSPTPQTVSKGLALTVSPAPLPLNITTPSPLPGGTVTQAYLPPVQLAATGGTPPLTWDLDLGSPALPNGLQLSSGGVLSGTPTTAVTVSPVFRVRDAATSPQQTATKPLAISIVLPAALNITTPSLPNGALNQPYDKTMAASGGSGTRIWSFQGGTIPNLTINSSTGRITGSPTPTGPFAFIVQVTDALFTDSQSYTITITAPPPPTITLPSSLQTGTVNVPYPSTTLTATGGEPPLTFQPVGMPFGLTFTAATATISGTPLSSGGPTNVTFTVNDSTVPFNQTGSRTYSLTINAALTIGTTSPLSPSGTVGDPYGPLQLLASGGTPPYTWSITGTGQPNQAAPGLTLSSGGVISGTPSTAGSFPRTYRVQDNNGAAVTKSLTLNVNAALTIETTSPLPDGKVGDNYGTVTPALPVFLTVSGGTPPYTWTLTTNPALPAGLSITPDPSPSATATISGVPTASESNVIHTFTVKDSTNLSVNKDLSLTIN